MFRDHLGARPWKEGSFHPKGLRACQEGCWHPRTKGQPLALGAAAGYTAEALKTHCSGALQAAAGHGGTKQGLLKFHFTTGDIYFKLRRWGGGGMGRNDPTQTVLILAKRCVSYWGFSGGAFLFYCGDGVAVDGMGKGYAALLLTPPHHSMPVHSHSESSVCK